MSFSLLYAGVHPATPGLLPGTTLPLSLDDPPTPTILRRLAAAIRVGTIVFLPAPTWQEIEADVEARTAELTAMIDARLTATQTRLHLAS